MVTTDQGLEASTRLRFGSLFSGIGGLDLGLERAGMGCVWQVEIDPFCRRVLAKHWPDVERHEDVRTAQPSKEVDLIAGGFPCQNLSSANVKTRTGLAGPKSGLWSAYLAVVQRVRPRFVIAENVSEWPTWTPQVRADLECEGYATTAVELCPGHFGAWARRPRVFVVADTDRESKCLSAIDAEVASLRPIARTRGHWRTPPPGVFRVADGPASGMDRSRAVGNAVVPQVAEWLGRKIMEFK